ncbi:MAG: HNH endonuclease [Myxococcaceae bacterium]
MSSGRRQGAGQRRKAGVAQAIKRDVQERDEGCCQWPLVNGGVCGETRFLQIDHVLPKAWGGLATADNLRVLCRRHNVLAAQGVFGEAWMERFTQRKATGTE